MIDWFDDKMVKFLPIRITEVCALFLFADGIAMWFTTDAGQKIATSFIVASILLIFISEFGIYLLVKRDKLCGN
jgi:uncharacterized membrane protein